MTNDEHTNDPIIVSSNLMIAAARSALQTARRAAPGISSLHALIDITPELDQIPNFGDVTSTIRHQIAPNGDAAGAEKMINFLIEVLPKLVSGLEKEQNKYKRSLSKKWWQFWL